MTPPTVRQLGQKEENSRTEVRISRSHTAPHRTLSISPGLGSWVKSEPANDSPSSSSWQPSVIHPRILSQVAQMWPENRHHPPSSHSPLTKEAACVLWANDFWNARKILTLWLPSADPGLPHLPNGHSWHLKINHHVINIIHKNNWELLSYCEEIETMATHLTMHIRTVMCERQRVQSVWPQKTGLTPLSAWLMVVFQVHGLAPMRAFLCHLWKYFRQSGLSRIPGRL